MATLVLTTVGTLLGGPIGGAIGAIAGQAIDAEIFKPKGREGPRLADLRVQTSSYGTPIPKLFGTMRVAGTVIWSTDLIEHRSKQGGGKGRPSTTEYSYTASFAVLLSARPIRSIGRIWADGNLLRGAGGDWKSATGFRLYTGGEDQPVDPLIASAEGIDMTPAWRGCAYALFEDMALADFGIRIPSLTFEIEAGAGPVALSAMLAELSAGDVAGAPAEALGGFAAAGDSLRGVVEALAAPLPLTLTDAGDALRIVGAADPAVTLDAAEIGDDAREDLAGAEAMPGEASLRYYDPARDFQAGLQRARRPGGGGRAQLDLPAALDAGAAKGIAEAYLARKARERGRRKLRCGWRRLDLRPGVIVRLPDDDGAWRVASRSATRDGVTLDLLRVGAGAPLAPPADAGRAVAPVDLPHGATTVHVLDLPSLADTPPDVPRLLVAAAGASPGWRRATLMVSLDGGASWDAIGGTAAPAVIGTALDALPAGGAALFDATNAVEIELLNEAMLLADADDARLIGGANLALLGDELIQFGRAEPLGGSRWRLSRLARGRRGTGWAAALHAVGERFVLIEAEALLAWDAPLGAIGGTLKLMASGIGDATPAETSLVITGEALRPPPPAQLVARRQADGGFAITWARSSRAGWRWIDGADAPLAEEREAYGLVLRRADGVTRAIELDAPFYAYPAADAATDRLAGSTVTFSIAQRGTHATSRATVLSVSLD